MTWLFQTGLAQDSLSIHLFHGAFCISQILTSLEDPLALVNKHDHRYFPKPKDYLWEKKDVEDIIGELHKANKILFS